MRVHITQRDTVFLKKSKNDVIWIERDDSLYLISPKSGALVIKIKGVDSTSNREITLPSSLVEQMIAGFYEIGIQREYMLISIYPSKEADIPIVAYRVYNAIVNVDVNHYIEMCNSKNYVKSPLTKSLLDMYSIITATTKQINHTIEFSKGIAYFNSPNLIVHLNKEIKDKNDFSINRDNMWFLTFSNNIEMYISKEYVSLKEEGTNRDYINIFYKIKTGRLPNIHRLDETEPIGIYNVNLNLFANVLKGLKEDRHVERSLSFLMNNMAVVNQGSIVTVVPIEKPPVAFEIDAVLMKKICSRINGLVSIYLYRNNFLLKNRELSIIGRCKINESFV